MPPPAAARGGPAQLAKAAPKQKFEIAALDGLSLDQLRTFIAAAEEGSFSAAGRKLQRAQSLVSQTLANLEEQIGVKLFDRSGRYPRLTEQGSALLRDARAVAEGMDGFKAHAKTLREGLEVLAVMATAGLYDDSGKWLYHTGLPAKSGVGGGIIAVSPGKFGVAVVSPPLDAAGNSVRAQKAIADVSNALGGNPYAAAAAARK